jgi:uncharacterized membrane protein
MLLISDELFFHIALKCSLGHVKSGLSFMLYELLVSWILIHTLYILQSRQLFWNRALGHVGHMEDCHFMHQGG